MSDEMRPLLYRNRRVIFAVMYQLKDATEPIRELELMATVAQKTQVDEDNVQRTLYDLRLFGAIARKGMPSRRSNNYKAVITDLGRAWLEQRVETLLFDDNEEES